MRAGLWLVIAAVLASCSSPPTQCRITEKRVTELLTAGQPIDLSVGIQEFCGTNQRIHVADEVSVEVFDPDYQPYPFVASKPMRIGGTNQFENVTTVSFTPDRVGSWHVNATFEPGIGRTQVVVQAVELRADAGVRVVPVELPTDCLEYAVTAQGTVLCARFPNGVCEVVAGAQRYRGTAFALDQDALWRVDPYLPRSIERLIEDAGVFQTTHRVDNFLSKPPGDVFPSALKAAAWGGDLWVFVDAALLHVSPQADGGLSIERTPFPNFTAEGLEVSAAGVVLFGRRLATTGAPLAALVMSMDGGSRGVSVPASASFIGADEDAFWMLNQQTLIGVRRSDLQTASVELPDGAGPRYMPPAFFPSTPAVPTSIPAGWNPSPTLRPQVVVPRLEGTKLVLERYITGGEYFPVANATRAHVFAGAGDGKSVKIFDR